MGDEREFNDALPLEAVLAALGQTAPRIVRPEIGGLIVSPDEIGVEGVGATVLGERVTQPVIIETPPRPMASPPTITPGLPSMTPWGTPMNVWFPTDQATGDDGDGTDDDNGISGGEGDGRSRAPWRAGLRETRVHNSRREPPQDGPAWGRQVSLFPAQQPLGVIRVHTERSTDFTFSVDVLQECNPSLNFRTQLAHNLAFVWAKVTFGNGAANVQRLIRCDYRIDTPIVGSYFDVTLYVGYEDGTPIPQSDLTVPDTSTPAIAVAQLSRGIRGTPYMATLFNSDNGTNTTTTGASVLDAPQRLCSVKAHLSQATAGNANRFLQLFDTTSLHYGSLTNIEPNMEWSLGNSPTTSGVERIDRLLNPRGFVNGIVWAVSSTSGFFTAANAATDTIWIELETQLL